MNKTTILTSFLLLFTIFALHAQNPGQNEMDAASEYLKNKELPKAIEMYQKAAEKGNPDALRSIGDIFKEGWNVPQDLGEAMKWYKKASDSGDGWATYNVADMYENGIEVPEDDDEALRLYKLSREQGHGNAIFKLQEWGLDKNGNITGRGRSEYKKGMRAREAKETEEAIKWLKLAAEQDHYLAMMNLGYIYSAFSGPYSDIDEAIRWVTKASEYGYITAMTWMARQYEQQVRRETDEKAITELEKKIAMWYKKAAENGDKGSMKSLAKMYISDNKAFEGNFDEGLEWLKKATGGQDIEPALVLTNMYRKGSRVEKDLYEARKWAQTMLGDNPSKSILEIIDEIDEEIRLSETVERTLSEYTKALEAYEAQNYEEALKWFQAAAEKENASAMAFLGKMYQSGLGVKENPLIAFNWYEKSAMLGDAEGSYGLGQLYQRGSILYYPQDINKAQELYEQSSNKGNTKAMIALGNIYHKKGAAEDIQYALKWWNKAAEKGDVQAMYLLGNVFKDGMPGVKSSLKAAKYWYQKSFDGGYELAEMGLSIVNLTLSLMKYDEETDMGKAELAYMNEKYMDAVNLWQTAAYKGVVDAMLELGDFYQNNEIYYNYSKALEWYEKAKKAGATGLEASIENLKQEIQKEQRASAKRTNEMVEHYSAEAAKGDPEALYYMAGFYARGVEVEQNQNEAFRLYKKAAEAGFKNAVFETAKRYEEGNGVAVNEIEAVNWYIKSAELNNEFAMTRLGVLYDTGRGVEKNTDEACKWFQDAADRGEINAKYYLGLKYEKGEGVKQDDIKAFRLFKDAAGTDHLNDPDADRKYKKAEPEIVELASKKVAEFQQSGRGIDHGKEEYDTGYEFYRKKDYTEAFSWLSKASEKGHILSMTLLAGMYSDGLGTSADQNKALMWTERAAEKGDQISMYKVAAMYWNRQDQTQAFKWYKISAEHDNPSSMNMLGLMYYEGTGTEKNMTEAVKWIKKSAEEKNSGGLFTLAEFYRTGTGVTQNLAEAYNLYVQSAEKGNHQAMYVLGIMYKEGVYVSADLAMAKEWLQKAADKGNEQAKQQLAGLNQNPLSAAEESLAGLTAELEFQEAMNLIQKGNLEEAFKYASLSAEKGNGNAMFLLATFYYEGKGTEQNLTKSAEWFQKSANKGVPEAIRSMGVLYENGIGVNKDLNEAKRWFQKAVEAGHSTAAEDLKRF